MMKRLFGVLCSGVLCAHPYFPNDGVDALLFGGPTYSQVSLDIDTVAFSQSATEKLTPPFAWGFTVGARLLLDHDAWDGSIIYYWNKSEKSATLSGAAALQFNIANDFPFPAYSVDDIEGTLDTSFKPLFLEIGRFISGEKKKGGLYRLHFGFAGTWENETLRLNADEIYSASIAQDVWGAGFRTGADMWYYFVPECGLHATAAASLLWTRYRVRRKDANPVQVINVESNFWKNSPGFDMSFGVHGEKEYTNVIIGGEIGWFMQVWTNHLRFFLLTQPEQQGNLSFQGLSTTLSISF